MWCGRSIDKEPEKDLAEKLGIPVYFSAATTKVVEAGILTKKAHIEITTSLSTLMLMYIIKHSWIWFEISYKAL